MNNHKTTPTKNTITSDTLLNLSFITSIIPNLSHKTTPTDNTSVTTYSLSSSTLLAELII